MIELAIVNASPSLSGDDVKRYVAAVQRQVHGDFAPAWGVDAKLTLVPKGKKPPAGQSWIIFLDHADAAGALGYHDVTSAGMPLGKVFVLPTLKEHGQVSVTFSHEVLEMLADPEINRSIKIGPRYYDLEVCDPVEADELGYEIAGVQVSNFVRPAYFQPTIQVAGPRRRYDHLGKLAAPIPAMLPGGYLSYLTPAGHREQIYAPETPTETKFRRRPHPGSRRERRGIERGDWLPSRVEVA